MKMGNLFNYDGQFMQILKKVMYIVLTNLLFLICSIPIVTIGAASSAMYTVLIKVAEGDEPSIFRTFFEAFKGNFKYAMLFWSGIILVLSTLLLNYFYANTNVKNSLVFRIIMFIVFIFLMVLWVYIFPVISYYKNSIKGYLLFSVILSVVQLPKTLVLIMLQVLPLGLFFLVQYVPTLALPFLLCGVSLPALGTSKILGEMFSDYSEENHGEKEEVVS